MENERLVKLRKNIDNIDKKILKLLNQRAELAIQIAEIKKQKGFLFMILYEREKF